MKSGLVHWCSEATAERAEMALNKQTGHTFLKISELGITVNTAQIEGVYLIEQYADMIKLKQGMWQCEYKKWHARKQECECRSDMIRKRNETLDRVREAQENRELTPEEFEHSRKKIDEIGELLRQSGIFVKKESKDTPQENCIICSNKLPISVKYYCSGECMEKAKSNGTLGREEELKEAANLI